MRKKLYLFALTLILCFLGFNSFATHIRAGEITAKVVNFKTRTYKFTLTLYLDITPGSVDQPDADLNFGDGTGCSNSKVIKRERINPETDKVTYEFVHSFVGDGTYLVSFNEENRNEEIKNIADGNSVNISFYVETELVIDVFNGINSTPVLLAPPIDQANQGVVYEHNPTAYDADGDSISYVLTVSKAFIEGEDGCGTGEPFTVPNYKLPNHPNFYDQPPTLGNLNKSFTMDPISGDLIWDVPGEPGLYNMAFVVEEWRKVEGEWVRLSYVTRDMQVKVLDSQNKPPKITAIKDTCIVAGTFLSLDVFANDPDGDPVKFSSYSGLYLLPNSPAHYTGPTNKEPDDPNDGRPVPVKNTFTWQTNCSHVRQNPYQVIFQATDIPKIKSLYLADIEVWNITVVAPAPVLLEAQPTAGKTIDLKWRDYYKTSQCSETENRVNQILVYRKKGPYPFTPENCEVGIPEGSGYELVGSVSDLSDTTFTDDNDLEKGVEYCYRLVAIFKSPGRGISYASNEICARLTLDVPTITNVTVDSTSTEKGVVTVKWIPPLELDFNLFKGPYKYELYRSIGLASSSPTLVASFNNLTDSIFVDKQLNTERNPYTYQILFYNNNVLLDSSAAASSVRLSAGGGLNSINLSWTFETPWTNTSYVIYRQLPGTTTFDSIGTSTTPAFIDDGKLGVVLNPELEYCYRVKAYGTYNNPMIRSPLINYSQITCQSPKDADAPCPPVLTISPKNCEEFVPNPECATDTYFNTLSWVDANSAECKPDIAYYNVYYAFSTDSTKFTKIASNLTTNTFQHKNNPYFYAGCYAITSVDRSGNESEYSNIVCNDNCPFIELPNVFTPNGDGFNDVFKPYEEFPKCSRFVESVEIIIVNRWGNVVYDSKKSSNAEQAKFINWDGKTNEGKELATGTYFYTAKVKFITLDPKKANQTLKGWVQILK